MPYRKLLTVAAVLLSVSAAAQKHSFAIVTDLETIKNCKQALEAYRQSVCQDGLDAFIVGREWSGPDELRDSLIRYHAERALKGAVFVGDVPIAMIQGAQHLTSAFKMDESGKWPRRDCSVPSDRFYDDFDLKFESLGRDSLERGFFYYRLAPDSPQSISCDIYTGRIKSSEKRGDKYGEISRYLLKAATAKKESNTLDHLMSYSGSGSFSNSLVAWKDESITLKEQFPEAFSRDSDGAKFYVYAMYPGMKDILLKEIAREDLDLALFHEHGMPERQYVTDTPHPTDEDGYHADALYRIRERLRREKARGNDTEKLKKEIVNRYGLTEAWVDGWDSRENAVKDSLYDAATGIMLDDIAAAAPNVRMTIFDACYNGDFREDDCIASRYILSDGKALVGIGNSVNVLQDKSSSDLMGMLSQGYRVGEWMQQVNILESHILGDPTFRFTPCRDAVHPELDRKDCAYWLKFTDEKYQCDIRGLALHKLFSLEYKDLSALLLKTFETSDEYMLRLQCFHFLAHYTDGNYEKALLRGADDPYEFIRRKSAYYMGKVGTPEMAEALAGLYLKDYNSLRVAANVGFSCAHFPDSLFLKEFEKQFSKADWIYDREAFHGRATALFRPGISMEEQTGRALADKNDRLRTFFISGMRNQPYPQFAEKLMDIVRDSSETTEIRVQCAEVLGWYTRAWNRGEIIEEIKGYMSSEEEIPSELRDELTKTLGRLKLYMR